MLCVDVLTHRVHTSETSMHRTSRNLALAALSLVLGLVVGLGSGLMGAAANVSDPGWRPVQEVPPLGAVHAMPLSAVFSDGTLVAVWLQEGSGAVDEGPRAFRSTRPPQGEWTDPLAFPVQDVKTLERIAPRPDGSLQIVYGWDPDSSRFRYQVRIWNADGSVEKAPRSTTAAPSLDGDPGDSYASGPGKTEWMAGYDVSRSRLNVRRWKPGMANWKLEWSRSYPSGHRRNPLVDGLDLAVGSAGRVVLAFQERETGGNGATVRAVRRSGKSGWTRPGILQRVPADDNQLLTSPMVAAAGVHAEVAWTSSAPGGQRLREIRIAQLGGGGRDVRRLAVATAFKGFHTLFLDVDLRDDGDILITYMERSNDDRDLVGWLGSHDGLSRTTLLEDVALDVFTSVLLPGLAAVISRLGDGRLASRVLEE